MKKLINDPERFVDETIAGIVAAHPYMIRLVGLDGRVMVRADAPVAGHVGIVTGGGSGHLPLFLGYVGSGLCSGVAIGNVFSSPSSAQIVEATQAVDGGAGVLYLYGNYGGDLLNFDLASERASALGIPTRTVVAADDVASAPPSRAADRRGVAGMVLAFKAAGAAAERGDDLDAVAKVAQAILGATRSMGVGLSPTVLPTAGRPTFEISDSEMEIGIGIHGERGVRRGELEPADAVADALFAPIAQELDLGAGDRVAVLVNGMGATPLEELYVLFRRVHERLMDLGVTIHRPYVGELATSLEMAGASLTITKLTRATIDLLDAPARSPFFRQ